jgi:hypothetical protein
MVIPENIVVGHPDVPVLVKGHGAWPVELTAIPDILDGQSPSLRSDRQRRLVRREDLGSDEKRYIIPPRVMGNVDCGLQSVARGGPSRRRREVEQRRTVP